MSIGEQAAWVAAATGLALVVSGSALVVRDLSAGTRAHELARRVRAVTEQAPTRQEATHEDRPKQGVDLDDLRTDNPDAVAWLFVEGTAVDSPVVQASDTSRDWYLSHDFWGEPSSWGCPYLDARCSPADAVLMVYGHHVSGTHEAFSDLSDACDPAAFVGLGSCRWDTGDGNTVTLSPLCSLRVESDDGLVGSVLTWPPDDLDGLLAKLCTRAEARSTDWAQGCARAQRALLLVTCSSFLPGQSGRTITVFCT
jgi:sortase B